MKKVLSINSVNVITLKEKFQTPLYVFDEDKIVESMKAFKRNFRSNMFNTKIIYASKAFSIKEMLRLCNDNGLCLDCVSYGELMCAKAVNYPCEKIYMHGNNKSTEELSYCIENNVNIIVDNVEELEMIIALAKGKKVNVFIRINTNIDAHTHRYIMTANLDSKFGVQFNSHDFNKIIDLIDENKNINLEGFHSHIGSQIFSLDSYLEEIKKMVSYCKIFSQPLSINLGGGFGINYTEEDRAVSLEEAAKKVIAYLEYQLVLQNVKIKCAMIEPGRSIVGEAGYTLHTIGFVKKTPNKTYYFIDGGMTDNIRVSLYQAKYRFDIATKMNRAKNFNVTIAGKCCESGDIIGENILLPEAEAGDILITYTTGAYGYSMASNYNKHPLPAVVFIKNGEARLVCKRQTYEDLLEREI